MQYLTWILVVGLVTLGGVSSVWFFRVRRYMILRMKQVAVELEEWLRPRDKLYTYLGYLVGFKAVYEAPRLPGVVKAWALYTQPPRHVLLYVPLVKAIGGRERLELTLRLKRLPVDGEVHLYAPWDRATRREVMRDTGGAEGYAASDTIVAGRRYLVLRKGGALAAAEAERLAGELAEAGATVLRVTLHPRLRALHVAVEPGPKVAPVLRVVSRAAARLAS